MKLRRSLAIALTAASLALAAIGGASASAAVPQDASPGQDLRDIVITPTSLSSLVTITPTGLQNTLPFVQDTQSNGPDSRS